MGKLKIMTQNCKSCEFCIDVCPNNVLEIGEDINRRGYRYVVVKRPEDCISCMKCAIMCPDAIIEVYK